MLKNSRATAGLHTLTAGQRKAGVLLPVKKSSRMTNHTAAAVQCNTQQKATTSTRPTLPDKPTSLYELPQLLQQFKEHKVHADAHDPGIFYAEAATADKKWLDTAAAHAVATLTRPSIHDPCRLNYYDCESLIQCCVLLAEMGRLEPQLGVHALATLACTHDDNQLDPQGPPKYLRNSVRWLQRQEMGYSTKILPSDLSVLIPNQTLLRLLWAASLHMEAKPATGADTKTHKWMDHEILYATFKMSEKVLTDTLTAQLAVDGKLADLTATNVASDLQHVTSPKLVGIAFLASACRRLQAVPHAPCGLLSQLLLCMHTALDACLTQLLDAKEACSEQELSQIIAIMGEDTAGSN